jgi:hypothetical protein
MHLCLADIPDSSSPKLPESVERPLGRLLESDGMVTLESLSAISDRADSDSNRDGVLEIFECEVVADGSEALRIILDGLRARLLNPITENERLVIRGD